MDSRLFLGIFLLGVCQAAWGVGSVEFRAKNPPSNWNLVDRAPETADLYLTFAIKQNNVEKIEQLFWAVSTPGSPQYKKYLSMEEITELVSPKKEDQASIEAFLTSFNITNWSYTQNGDFMKVLVPVGLAEKMFGCLFHTFQEISSKKRVIRTLGPYYLPLEVASSIDFVGGITRFPKSMKVLRSSPKEGDAQIIPSVAKQTLNIPSDLVGTNSQNSQSISQFLEQYYSSLDLAKFQGTFNLAPQPVAKEIGPNDESDPGAEADLDTEWIMAIAPKVPTWFISTPGEREGQEPFLDWIVALSNTTDAPWVNSVSYGDDENSLETDFTSRVNIEFQKFGLRGRSILFASGDDGVGCDKSCKIFVPNFPASSPYVTTVGGIIQSTSNKLTGDSISSGGFSNYFDRPSYQAAAVSSYLKGALPPATFFNATGRAMPDVAAFSENVIIIFNKFKTPVGGTSCAAPIFAGVISLINDQLLNQGKAPLGFLNPFLYSTFAKDSTAFNDITTGSNPLSCCPGFQCRAGWDPVTGLGVPNYPSLLKNALAL